MCKSERKRKWNKIEDKYNLIFFSRSRTLFVRSLLVWFSVVQNYSTYKFSC